MGNHATTVFYGDDLQDATWNNSDFDDGSELITNGTMESNANWGNATSNSPASQGQSTEQEHAGSNSWKLLIVSFDISTRQFSNSQCVPSSLLIIR